MINFWAIARTLAARQIAQPDNSALSALTLSNSTVNETAAVGSTIGYLQNVRPGSTIKVVSQSNAGMLGLNGHNVVVGPAGLDYAVASAPTITLQEIWRKASNNPRTTVLAMTVNDVDPVITSSANINVDEGVVLAHALTADEPISTWTIRTVGQNAASLDHDKFEINGSTLRWLANGTKDFAAPDDSNTDNVYVVVVRATDLDSNITDQTISVTVNDV